MTNLNTQLNDATLIRACQTDDQEAFCQLVQRHQATAFRFAFRLAAETPEAEDLCQKAFLKVWNYRLKIQPDSKFTTLLYTIISHLWIDHSRSLKRRFLGRNVVELQDGLMSDDASPESLSINQDLANRIRRLSRKLPPRQRLVFTLRDLEDLSIQEVVKITGISTAGVKTNLSIARRKLREQMQAITGMKS